MRCYGMTAQQAADAPKGRIFYTYEGEYVTLRQAAERTGMSTYMLKKLARIHGCGLEEAVRRFKAELAERRRKAEEDPDAEKVARRILRKVLLSEPEEFGFRAIAPGRAYGIRTETYDIRVDVDGATATLTATARDPGRVSIRRRYAIARGEIVETR